MSAYWDGPVKHSLKHEHTFFNVRFAAVRCLYTKTKQVLSHTPLYLCSPTPPRRLATNVSPTSVSLASSPTAVVSFGVMSDPGRLHVDVTNLHNTTPAQLVNKELELRTHRGCVSSCCTPSHSILFKIPST